jgi:hypothetical protein
MNKKPVVVIFKLHQGKDDDLIEWLKSIGTREKSALIRLAIRQFVQRMKSSTGVQFMQPQTIIKEQSNENNTNNPVELSDDELESRLDKW